MLDAELQLARVSRDVETKIKAELSRLPQSHRKAVLARVVLDVEDEAAVAAAPVAPTAVTTKAAAANSTGASKSKPKSTNETQGQAQGHIWQKVLAYCQANPGPYHYVDVAKAAFPDKMTPEGSDVFVSTLSTILRRRCVNKPGAKDPYFWWLDNGKFRLATPDERAKALEKEARDQSVRAMRSRHSEEAGKRA